MFIETILAELKRERAQLDRAIAALEGTGIAKVAEEGERFC
jgi:hypothetical protein